MDMIVGGKDKILGTIPPPTWRKQGKLCNGQDLNL
jgi:hypothetical protein